MTLGMVILNRDIYLCLCRQFDLCPPDKKCLESQACIKLIVVNQMRFIQGNARAMLIQTTLFNLIELFVILQELL